MKLDTDALRDAALWMLEYNPLSGLFTWKVPPNNHWRLKGAVAGRINNQGYVVIKIQKSAYRAHRLAWLVAHGVLPPEIDHINRVRSDNRLENLRAATRLQNMKNHSRHLTKVGLPLGVSTNGRYYRSRISCDGKLITLGNFQTPELAGEAYKNARKTFHGEFCPQ